MNFFLSKREASGQNEDRDGIRPIKDWEAVMRKNGDIGLEGGGVLDADISRALRESAPTVRQSIEEWLRQSLAAKEAREARMEEMRLYLASTRDDRERRVREQAEAWERKKAMLEDKVEILGYSLETPGEILAEEAAPGDGGLIKVSERAREALEKDMEFHLVQARA